MWSDELEQMLSHLQLSEFISEQPAVGEVEYGFKHALTQEVVYNSILIDRRRLLHERTGTALEELYSQQRNEHYGDLAHHFLRGIDVTKAIHYAQLAAMRALNRGTYAEASSLVEVALKLLDKLPERDERLRVELALRSHQSVLAGVLYAGSSLERELAIKRVCELSEIIGEADQLLSGLVSLCSLYFLRGESVRGLELGRRCLGLADSRPRHRGSLRSALYLRGICRAPAGICERPSLSSSRHHFTQAAPTDDSLNMDIFIRRRSPQTRRWRSISLDE